MMKHSVLGTVVGALILWGGMAAAHTRTPWKMHHGLEVTDSNPSGLVPFTCTPLVHGDSCEYNVASIPAEGHSGWTAAPDGERIDLGLTSRVCAAPITCKAYGDFTYFQTFVNVEAGHGVNEFTLSFSDVDDGVRVTLFNSLYPNGISVPQGFLYLHGTWTTGNLAAYLMAGELNRVVLTHVDDCCGFSGLAGAVIRIDGVEPGFVCEGNSDCNDGNACTADICTPQGTCSNPMLACSNGQSCSEPVPMFTRGGEVTAQACTPNPSGEPTLVVNGDLDMTLECGEDIWVDAGAQAWDAACNPLTVHTYNTGHDAYGPGPNTCAEGTYSVQYIAWDAQGKTVSAIRSVKVDDTKAPTFSLKGPTHMVHQCGSGYVEPGWTAYDACYGDITPEVKVFGYPNGWVEGTYTVTYTLTDSGGNSAPTLTRTVEVVNCP